MKRFTISVQPFDQLISSQKQAEANNVKLGERDKIIALQQTISPYGKVKFLMRILLSKRNEMTFCSSLFIANSI